MIPATLSWRRWLNRLARLVNEYGRPPHGKRCRRLMPRLVLESLEDRIAPAASLLKDIGVALGSPGFGYMTAVGSTLYFSASDSINSGLGKWDGSNFTLIPIGNSTYGGSSPSDLTAMGGNLYFGANDGTGNQLFKYDGSNLLEIPINPNGSPKPFNLSAIGNTLYLTADDGSHGFEPWTVTASTPTVPTPVVPTNAVYNGQPQGATDDDVIGDNGADLGPPTLTYYAGTYTLANLPSSGDSSTAPTNAGNYTVVASYAGNVDYTSAHALATYSISKAKLAVTSTADDASQGTLRYAITQANTGNFSEIDFAIGVVGSAQTIHLTSALPTLTGSGVSLNGLSQGGSGNTQRLITLDGSGAGSSSDGLILQGWNGTVSGLILSNFGDDGIKVEGPKNTIGGTAAGAGNVISGNHNDSVFIDSSAWGVQVQGNYIGNYSTGSAAQPNKVGIEDAGSYNTIGGSVAGARNFISGNMIDGILLDSTAWAETVQGNYIGLSVSGKLALANRNGIEVAGGNNTIGGDSGGNYYTRNFISGNSGDGVLIDGGATGNLVQGNFIGIDVSGTSSGYTNVISGSTNDGVLIDSTAANNLIQGSYIGTDYTGKNAVSNSGNGLEVQGTNNTIGGVYPARNYISANSKDGLLLGSKASGNQVLDNFIGLDISGTHGIGNLNGIEIAGTGNTIGGTVAGSINVISANKNDGILLDATASGNLVLGSFVGTDYSGKNGVANSGNGIEVAGAGNTLGGTTSAVRNIISGNSKDGVLLDSTASGTLVLGNYIGVNYSGAALGNSGNGVEMAGNNNTVGGSASGAGNIISDNSKNGVLVSAGSGDTMSRNSIFGNTLLGISLASGANNNIVAPSLSSATISGSTLTVQGSFAVPTANVAYVLQFFANLSGDAEGRIYLGSLTVTPTSTGLQNFTFRTTTTVTGTDPLITATLTDNSGDTSQFSNGVTVS